MSQPIVIHAACKLVGACNVERQGFRMKSEEEPHAYGYCHHDSGAHSVRGYVLEGKFEGVLIATSVVPGPPTAQQHPLQLRETAEAERKGIFRPAARAPAASRSSNYKLRFSSVNVFVE